MPTDIRERRRIGAGHNIPSTVNVDPQAFARYFQQEVTGSDLYGTLGEHTPSQPAMPQEATQFAPTGNAIPASVSPHDYYTFHLGDLFFPGAPAWVLDQKTETPLMCIWGNGLLLAPNRGFQAFPPTPPDYAPTVPRMASVWGAQASYNWFVDPLGPVSLNPSSAQDNAPWDPSANVTFDPLRSDY